jgi:hypothetical protein
MRITIGSFAWVAAVLLITVATLTLFCGCEPEDETPTPPEPSPPPTGHALAIGLNKVNPAHYGGWDGELSGCEPDARDMQAIAQSQGLNVEMLLTEQATYGEVLNKLDDLANLLKSGDLLVVSYSGHGGHVPDLNGDEADGLDETWCLYDGQLLDDELYGAWMKFQAGIRILVFSDSCHSGTVLRMMKTDLESPTEVRVRELDEMWKRLRVPPKLDRAKMLSLPEMREAVRVRSYLRDRVGSLPPSVPEPEETAIPQPVEVEAERVFVSRSIPPGILMKTYEQNRSLYDERGKAAPKEDSDQVKASVVLISGCEDSQTSADIGFNGLFTWMLKNVWNNGAFSGDHHKFHEDIRERVQSENAGQSPAFFLTGQYNEVFIGQRPYTVK